MRQCNSYGREQDSIAQTVVAKPISYTIPFCPVKEFLGRWPEQGNHVCQMIYVVLFILWSSSRVEQISVPKQVPDLQTIISVNCHLVR